jgi:hypothetical protein
MKGLMEMLAKSPSDDSKSPLGSPSDSDGDEGSVDSGESFDASAAAAMDAVKSGDSEAFAEALKACIEMSR